VNAIQDAIDLAELDRAEKVMIVIETLVDSTFLQVPENQTYLMV